MPELDSSQDRTALLLNALTRTEKLSGQLDQIGGRLSALEEKFNALEENLTYDLHRLETSLSGGLRSAAADQSIDFMDFLSGLAEQLDQLNEKMDSLSTDIRSAETDLCADIRSVESSLSADLRSVESSLSSEILRI
ncbi:hypothetical protein [uncultured Oscillibacter sp.]|uniref:hypothetical protein n=1 Tax=uncultured Oscillibacter sp. TaxID=876091 RepID=UPI002602E1C2|nr:hypothetical protein [uncultured Oscillibacter sp.]